MPISVTIKNDEPEGSTRLVAVTVVTVGDQDATDTKHELAAQKSMNVAVSVGQFVMVDETDLEGT